MSFPTSTPSYTGFTSTHTLAQDTHAAQHNQEQTDIIGLANKVGTGASTPAQNTVLRGNGTGTTVYDTVHMATDVSGILATTNGGNGTSSTTGTGSAVFGTSPTLITPSITSGGSWTGSPSLSTPTIADFSNSQHNHQNAAGGGTLNAASALQSGSITSSRLGSDSSWSTITITPAIIGWGSTTMNVWQYFQIGKMVWLYFDVSGTSNSTSTSVTLPVVARSLSGTNHFEGTYGLSVDNGGVQTGPRWSIDLSINANSCSFFTSYAGGGWTASGTKQIRGFIIYETT